MAEGGFSTKSGWAAPNWPVEYGGQGWTPSQKYVFDSETSAAGTPPVVPMGLKMVAPVIMAFGTEAQKKRHLPPILASELWWCQGYSEPGSGSDLASLAMRCEDKGDHYLLNGSKIWTTHAQWADWMFNLVRTTPGGKPQDGISFLLVDMKTPGIKVEAIVTTDVPMPGQQEINQVFYDDVKVPKENLIGEANKGWTYAKYLLEFERGNAGAPGLKRAIKKIREIAGETDASGERLIDDTSFRSRLDQLEIDVTAMEFVELRIFSALSAGARTGARVLDAQMPQHRSAAGDLRIVGGGAGLLRDARHPRHLGANQRTASRSGLRGTDRPLLFQPAQSLDLRRLQRDPAQHHGEGRVGVVRGAHREKRQSPDRQTSP